MTDRIRIAMHRPEWAEHDAARLRAIATELARAGWSAADIECIEDTASLLDGIKHLCDACDDDATKWTERDGAKWWWCEKHAQYTTTVMAANDGWTDGA